MTTYDHVLKYGYLGNRVKNKQSFFEIACSIVQLSVL